jgi:type II secretory pathway pseudopilin PulG
VRRGYLLIEAVLTGVIVASLLTAVLVQLGGARDEQIIAQRRAVAARLAAGRVQALQATGFDALPVGTTSARVQVARGGTYELVTNVTAGADAFENDGFSLSAPFKDLDTTASFTVQTLTYTERARGRIYQGSLR